MTRQTLNLSPELYQYLQQVSLREAEVLRELREETASHRLARMQISPEQGQFMQLLVRLMGARRTLEIGVFTGYSSLAVALALPPDGHITACDVSAEFTGTARRYWQKAGVAGKIDLRLAPALKTLDALIAAGNAGQYDLAFIDADKINYIHYYERCLTLLRPGGLILVDNVLWGGKVAAPENGDTETGAIRDFNRALHSDGRIELSVLPVGDGLTLALKKP